MNCYLCGKTKFELVSDRLRYGENRNVQKCSFCGLIFIYPFMTKTEEDKFYQEEYGKLYAKEKDTTPEDLFNSRYPEATVYYNLVKPYLKKKDKCLELGCASGYFLNFIRDKVGAITGYEPFIEFRRYCEKLNIPMIDNLNKCPDESYDKILMFFLIEHLTDPVTYLKDLNRLLKPDGLLLMIVPNIGDVLLSTYDLPKFKEFYFTLAHPFYYSKNTLTMLLNKAGFSDYKILPQQRYDLSNHLNWMMHGKPGGQRIYNHIFSKETLDSYAQDLKKQFKCDTLFGVARKYEKN